MLVAGGALAMLPACDEDAGAPGGGEPTDTVAVTGQDDATGSSVVTSSAPGVTTGATSTSSGVTTGGPFTFLAYGDSRAGNGCDGNLAHLALVERMSAEPASMVFHLGDMVTGYDTSTNWVERGACTADGERGSFREIIAPLLDHPPTPGLPVFFFPVMGNHDDNWNDQWYPDAFGNGFCDVFDPSLLVPNHTASHDYFLDWTSPGVPHFTDDEFRALACSTTQRAVYPDLIYYAFDFGGSHFVVMRINSDYHNLLENCADEEEGNYDRCYNKHQLDWLRWDLARAKENPAIQNVFLFTHAPLFTTSDGHEANSSWSILAREIAANGKVKVVFSGHNHVYERSFPLTLQNGTLVRDDAAGTVFTVSGGGGSAFHGFRTSDDRMAKTDNEFHYLRVDVDGAAVAVNAISINGAVIDTYQR